MDKDTEDPTAEAVELELETDDDEPHGSDLGEITEGEWVDEDEDDR
jgi:hypothetical protein